MTNRRVSVRTNTEEVQILRFMMDTSPYQVCFEDGHGTRFFSSADGARESQMAGRVLPFVGCPAYTIKSMLSKGLISIVDDFGRYGYGPMTGIYRLTIKGLKKFYTKGGDRLKPCSDRDQAVANFHIRCNNATRFVGD